MYLFSFDSFISFLQNVYINQHGKCNILKNENMIYMALCGTFV